MKYQRKNYRNKQTLGQKINKQIFNNIETKFRQLIETSTYNTTGQTYLLNDIEQGDSQTQRDGNRVKARSYYLSLLLTANPTLASSTYSLSRVIIYHKKNASSSSIAMNYKGVVDQDLYTVHYDSGIIGLTGDKPIFKRILKKRFYNNKITGMNIQYFGTTGTAISEKPIYIYVVNNADGTPPTLDITGKFYFKDV